jgi:hypothetical protein
VSAGPAGVRPMRVMPGTTAPRNGLPPAAGYVYRGSGKDTLTPPHVMAAWARRERARDARPPGPGTQAEPAAEPLHPVPPAAAASEPVDAGRPGRLEELEGQLAARGVVTPAGPPEPSLPPPAARRCGGCGYTVTAPGHKFICGESS